MSLIADKVLNLIFFLVVFILLQSCNKSRVEGEETFDFSVKSKNISTGDKLGQFYFFNQVKNDSLFVFNVYNHSLEIINIPLGKISGSIGFEFNGPNAVNDIRGFHFHSKDSIFLAEGNTSIALMNSKGDLIDRYSQFDQGLESKVRNELYKIGPNLEFSSQLLFNSITKEIIFYYMSFDQPQKRKILAAYSIENRKTRTIPIYYPEELISQKLDLSKLFLTSATLHDNKLGFIFSGSPAVSLFDFETNKILVKKIDPLWEKSTADLIPFENMPDLDKKEFMARNPFYYKIYYDSNKKIYYRLSSPPREIFQEDDFHYVFYNKIMISLLDEDLNLLSNFYLPKENLYNVGFSFVTHEGLWISYNSKNQDDENFIKGDLIKIEKTIPIN